MCLGLPHARVPYLSHLIPYLQIPARNMYFDTLFTTVSQRQRKPDSSRRGFMLKMCREMQAFVVLAYFKVPS